MLTKAWIGAAGLAAVAALGACSTPVSNEGPANQGAQQRATAADIANPKEVAWFRTAAEKTALYSQVYRMATERLPALASGLSAGSWAIVMDADETVLDNSPFQLAMARSGGIFTEEAWQQWVERKQAAALPGAKEFIARVREAGGKVIIVTNRSERACPVTGENFVALGIEVDGMLCAPPGNSDKNPRFASIQNGNSALRLPPLRIVAYVGDNIRDFPGRTQAAPGPLDDYGKTLFVLPNPMYGSWEKNTLE